MYKKAFILALAIFLTACESKKQEDSMQKNKITFYKICNPKVVNVNTEEELFGKVESQNSYPINSPLDGKILKLYVKNGDLVKKGQLIAKIDSSLINFDKNSIVYEEKALNDEINYSLKKLSKDKELYKLGTLPYQTILDEEKNVNILQNKLKALKERENYYNKEISYSNIYASHAGYVSNLIPQGTLVSKGQTIGNLNSKNSLYVNLSIPFGINIKKEDKVLIKGEMFNVSSVFSDNSGQNFALVNLDKGNFQPGEPIKAKLVKKERGLFIPQDSVVLINNNPGVFIDENKVAHFKPIKIVKALENGYLIYSLNQKDSIVCEGASLLKDGDKIR